MSVPSGVARAQRFSHSDVWFSISARILERISASARFAKSIPSADAHCALARVLRAQGHPKLAVAECEKALDVDPRHAEATQLLGTLKEKGKDR